MNAQRTEGSKRNQATPPPKVELIPHQIHGLLTLLTFGAWHVIGIPMMCFDAFRSRRSQFRGSNEPARRH